MYVQKEVQIDLQKEVYIDLQKEVQIELQKDVCIDRFIERYTQIDTKIVREKDSQKDRDRYRQILV